MIPTSSLLFFIITKLALNYWMYNQGKSVFRHLDTHAFISINKEMLKKVFIGKYPGCHKFPT